MEGEEVARRRMANLRLTHDPLPSAAEVVGWLLAVQSQDHGPAIWSVGQRSAGLGVADIARAYADGAILRTHVLRPTWHYVLPADIRWLLALTRARVHALNAFMYRQEGLDDAVLLRGTALIAEALSGGRHRTRTQLQAVLADAGIALERFGLSYLCMYAELEGVICSGAPAGKQHTYALLDERAPAAPERDREEALAELARRYAASHGPVTAKDLQWWSSLPAAAVRAALAGAAPWLERTELDGIVYWESPAPPPQPVPSPTVHLVHGYDEYVVGVSESRWVLHGLGPDGRFPPGTTVPNGVLLLDTRVAGAWRRTLTRRGVTVEALLHRPFDDAEHRALVAAVERHGAFLGVPATVTATVP